MMNHAVAADVTLGHYVAKSDAQLRAGWQAVADWIEQEAALATRLAAGGGKGERQPAEWLTLQAAAR